MELVKHTWFPLSKEVVHKDICPYLWHGDKQTSWKALNTIYGHFSLQMHTQKCKLTCMYAHTEYYHADNDEEMQSIVIAELIFRCHYQLRNWALQQGLKSPTLPHYQALLLEVAPASLLMRTVSLRSTESTTELWPSADGFFWPFMLLFGIAYTSAGAVQHENLQDFGRADVYVPLFLPNLTTVMLATDYVLPGSLPITTTNWVLRATPKHSSNVWHQVVQLVGTVNSTLSCTCSTFGGIWME